MACCEAPPNAPTLVPPDEADPAHELFEIYDENCQRVGTELRGIVHKTGLLHKAAYCFVFDKQGRLLIQRRSSNKKIGPSQWDLSVAEHLSPGETFRQAVQRGLQEELGITDSSWHQQVSRQPLGPMHRRSVHIPGLYLDNEFVESYELRGFDGQVQYNPAEVSEVGFIDLKELQSQMAESPYKFTQWFREEILLLGFFVTAETPQELPGHGDPNLN
eukprot:GHUV01006283.1.p1 GENE.GHUV01006283.1~~GHUV01006283.1.p1  ORF type:complete len:217 (+),score=38.23 GHUV01006283.1:384-1034(+)